MGLGADTIQAFVDGPYRRAEEMRMRDLSRIRAVVDLRRAGVPDFALHFVASACGSVDVFEAVAHNDITPEDGGWFLALMRVKRPWYLRLALWAFGSSLHKGPEQKP